MPTDSALPIAGACRLVTRSDFDGLVCAVLLRVLDMIDEITFVHPKDVQDGAVPIGPGCRLCERAGCPQRAFPLAGRPLDVDADRSVLEPYPAR